jgi:hypothetical protein
MIFFNKSNSAYTIINDTKINEYEIEINYDNFFAVCIKYSSFWSI